MPVFAVSGFRNSGKTTLIEAVIPVLLRQGLRVAVVKRDEHGGGMDQLGKDSQRFFAAGSDLALCSPGEVTWRNQSGDDDRVSVIRQLAETNDLVLVEGGKTLDLPRVWLQGTDHQAPPDWVTGIQAEFSLNEHRVERFLNLLLPWLDQVWKQRPLYACILVGGRSRRMQQPKQLIEWNGRSWLEHIHQVLSTVAERVLLVGDGPLPNSFQNHSRIPDVEAVQGPLAGILAALRWRPDASWLISACDQPLMGIEAIRWLVDERRPGCWAIMPRIPGSSDVEPLLAIYDGRIRSLYEKQIVVGDFCPLTPLATDRVARPVIPAEFASAWTNVNTPRDLQRIQTG